MVPDIGQMQSRLGLAPLLPSPFVGPCDITGASTARGEAVDFHACMAVMRAPLRLRMALSALPLLAGAAAAPVGHAREEQPSILFVVADGECTVLAASLPAPAARLNVIQSCIPFL